MPRSGTKMMFDTTVSASIDCFPSSRTRVRTSVSPSLTLRAAILTRRFRSYSHGLAPIEAGENALILTSMPPGQVVDDSDGSPGLLITALVDGMNSSTGSVEQIFHGARLAVARKTQNQQIPNVSSSLIDDVKLGPA